MRCSVLSLEREEPLLGTAPVARRWLMLEVSRAWESEPLDTPPITEGIRELMSEVEASHSARVVLVRRPGRSLDKPAGRWWAVDTTTRRQVSGSWSAATDLITAAQALGEPLSSATEPAEPALLVCTHGTRDVCCAIEGRQLARTLEETYGDEVWECTHLGGHRFAPTFAILPDGAVYGRATLREALAIVEGHRSGHVRADHLRGVSRYSPPEQAAVCAVLERFGPAGLDDVLVLATERTGDHEWRVRLGGDDPVPETLVATVVGKPQPPLPLSCGPAKPKPSTTYEVTAVDIVR